MFSLTAKFAAERRSAPSDRLRSCGAHCWRVRRAAVAAAPPCGAAHQPRPAGPPAARGGHRPAGVRGRHAGAVDRGHRARPGRAGDARAGAVEAGHRPPGLARPADRRGGGAPGSPSPSSCRSVLAGVVHAIGGWRPYLGLLPLQVHVGAAIAVLPFAVPRGAGGSAPGARTCPAVRPSGRSASARPAPRSCSRSRARRGPAGAPGGGRRETGSHEVGSGDPARMPVTHWFLDPVPAVAAATWRLRVGGRARMRSPTGPRRRGDRDARLHRRLVRVAGAGAGCASTGCCPTCRPMPASTWSR